MSGPVILSVQGIAKAYGAAPLFSGLSLAIAEGDRVGVVGPNGSGKSTLLRILAGLETPDAGTRALRRLARVGFVAQDPGFPAGATVEQVVAEAIADDGPEDHGDAALRVAKAVSRAGFADPTAPADTLSGGWRKRLAIVRALAREPDVLLLDEPTNHLDVEGIVWLEALLRAEPRACLLVSHDRWFLENVAERMIEIDRIHPSGIFATSGRYSDFLERRDAALREQAAYRDTLANRVRGEIAWLRQGAKARTTKQQARIAEAARLIGELAAADDRARAARPGIAFTASGRQTRRLVVASRLGKDLGGRTIVGKLDLVLGPGVRLGLLGANGSGKSTLLGLLAKAIAPDRGAVTHADDLRVVHFTQERAGLDPTWLLRRVLAGEADTVIYRDRPVHVASWAKRFLFQTEQLGQPVGRLSGGERARVHIARLMLQPADVLLLDEPTNDLDIPTLEILEESLLEFPGAIVLVTHDRFLLDRVSSSLLALDGAGGVQPYADLAQWQSAVARTAAAAKAARPRPATPARAPAAARRLGYHEQREWEAMEATILAAEAELEARRAALTDPAIAADAGELARRLAAAEAASTEVDRLYARWSELEAKRA
ncbi:MAG: ABC-F family ATP-binding cassette domain-containing protein [Deltaproteobacteria bacterium]|nr:ABC-F family ATP-binding cassette domain-containing protein [Deltaproteobacteria bacterium]